MKRLAANSGKIWGFTSAIAGVVLTFNMLLIIANIIMRRFFNAPIYGSTELVRYASLVGASFGLAQNEWFEGNIKMTLLTEHIEQKAADIIRFICDVICSIAFSYISYLLIIQAVSKYIKADASTDLRLPIFVFASILAFGFIVLTICLIIKAIIQGYIVKTGTPVSLRPSNPDCYQE